MYRRVVVALAVAALSVPTTPLVAAGGASVVRDGTAAPSTAGLDTGSAIVVLTGDPLATNAKVDRTRKNRVDLNGSATKSVRAQMNAQKNAFKKWLQRTAPRAQVVGSYDIALNAVAVRLNGTPLATLRGGPGVVDAQPQAVFRKMSANPSAVDPDLALIGGLANWGGADAGAGVKVAVIDSGIDEDHPCFTDDPNPNSFTNDKVIVAKVFNNKAGKNRYTPEAIDSHGTHVAGTIACRADTAAEVDGVAIPYAMSGVAPGALLGNYNVFPGTIEDARDEDILNALEAAYADGMDVANMSLGGSAGGIQDLTSRAVNNLDRAGMVVVVAAGNEGPGPSTAGSPGTAERALTVGATTVPHALRIPVTVGGTTSLGVLGEFGAIATPVTGTLDVVADAVGDSTVTGISLACAPIPPTTLSDQVAVIARGVCDFALKMRYVQAAGYTAAIVVNRLPGVFTMAGDELPDPATIPGVLVDLADRDVVDQDGQQVTLGALTYVELPDLKDQMADFSSEGPTRVDARIKPDVVAPGANVLSSIPGGEFAFFDGTSMATPHVAGAAAVVLAAHPEWQAWQVRSAITNTAALDRPVPLDAAQAGDPNLIGAGLLDVPAARAAGVFLSQVSVSFGTIPSGSGQRATRTFTVTAENGTAVPSTGVAIVDATRPWFTATSSANGTVAVTVSVPKGAPAGGAWATLEVAGVHARVYVRVG